MNCPYCGAALPAGTQQCSRCGQDPSVSVDRLLSQQRPDSTYSAHPQSYSDTDAWPQTDEIPISVPRRTNAPRSGKGRRLPPVLLRIPLQLLSLVLCVLLLISVTTTALLLDISRIFSSGGIKQLAKAIFSTSQASPGIRVGAVGMDALLDDADIGSVEIPTDVLTGGDSDALVDWIVEMISTSTGSDVEVDREQIQNFIDQSTVSDYIAEKAAGYAQDFINGTQDTLITSEELMQLVEENQDLINSTFQIELTDDMKTELETALTQTIEDNRINEVIHEEVFSTMQESIAQSLPVEWETLQNLLQLLTSQTVLTGAIVLCAALMLLLCVLNFYNVPAGLTWCSVPCILAGTLLSLPIAVLQASPALLTDLTGVSAAVTQLILSFTSVLGLVHYGVLALGVALLLLSIVWRIARACARRGTTAVTF